MKYANNMQNHYHRVHTLYINNLVQFMVLFKIANKSI